MECVHHICECQANLLTAVRQENARLKESLSQLGQEKVAAKVAKLRKEEADIKRRIASLQKDFDRLRDIATTVGDALRDTEFVNYD